nr:hypothetical protein [Tanacetum cinerariifolium]
MTMSLMYHWHDTICGDVISPRGSVWMHPSVYSCIMFRHLFELVGIPSLFSILIHLIHISYDILFSRVGCYKSGIKARVRRVEPRLLPVEPRLHPVEPRLRPVEP